MKLPAQLREKRALAFGKIEKINYVHTFHEFHMDGYTQGASDAIELVMGMLRSDEFIKYMATTLMSGETMSPANWIEQKLTEGDE